MLQQILSRREGSAIYGTPEIMAQYKLESYRLQCQLDSINSRLGEDVDLEKSAQRYQLQQRITELRMVLQQRESSCIYGSPEVMEEYGRETQRMRGELEELQKQLKDLNQ